MVMLGRCPIELNGEWSTCAKVSTTADAGTVADEVVASAALPESGEHSACPRGFELASGGTADAALCEEVTASPGACIVSLASAFDLCAGLQECDGVSWTSNSGWRRAFPGMAMLGRRPVEDHPEWTTCAKHLPKPKVEL
eukprot:TRINITY_DN13070_c0_g1_i1.p1 TRINITY_DN13070_c0_g1~~TRINITY_DN13070_c0_g1_i1.p1  ORF type:complete len:140 (+),score=22.85 TRINITY_DN13070_c0_g1_i1:446-865(+)